MKIEKVSGKADFSLSRGKDLSLFFIGAGSAFTKTLNQTNIIITKGGDHLMVDCGMKTPQALFELGLAPRSIENFFITHTHADHTGGLEEIALTARYGTKKKPRIYIPEYFEDILWNFTLRGGCAYNERNRGRPLEFADFWDVRRPRWLPGYPRETWEFDVGSINLKAFRTKHIPDSAVSWEDSFPSFGLLVDDRVLFTGDTRYDPDLVRDYGSRAKIEAVFHDCQLFPGGVHASLEEISRLPAKIKARTRLMHYQDTWEKSIDAAAAAGFAGFAEQNAFYVFP